ncbi:MAG: hypothetical protein PW734_07050 [Verrucomicrobium sp.]|nr:hypothetical protein [Verrucomicrobium sp.]
MAKRDFAQVIQEICEADPRYTADCYGFVREGLDHTLKNLKRASHGPRGHVSGQELLGGLRDYALDEFGPMSKAVLNEWGITRCEDFGEIVFNLVKFGILGKTDTDSLNDFREGFNFHDAFVKPFRPHHQDPRGSLTKLPRVPRPRKNKPGKKSSGATKE